jgi:transcription initiation factor TFIIIB Brf1 subunit/transcription initiation factor TFIIB
MEHLLSLAVYWPLEGLIEAREYAEEGEVEELTCADCGCVFTDDAYSLDDGW